MEIEHIELHVEFPDRLQMLIDCAHEQDGNFHDRWRENSDAFTAAAIQGGSSTHTYAYTIIYVYVIGIYMYNIICIITHVRTGQSSKKLL